MFTHIEVRGQLAGVGSLFPPYLSQGSNSNGGLGSKHLHPLSHLVSPPKAFYERVVREGL